MTPFKDISLRAFRSVGGLKKELGKLSDLLEQDDNLIFGFDPFDTEEYISIEKTMQVINHINRELQCISGDIGRSIIKFLALMKLYKAYEIIPDEFLYKELYKKRIWEHDIEIGSSWNDVELELVKFEKCSQNSEEKEVVYLFAEEEKKIDQKRCIQFGFNSSGYIVIKNATHFSTDTNDYQIIAYENKIVITSTDNFMPTYKVMNVGEDVVQSTRYDGFETVDYHTL